MNGLKLQAVRAHRRPLIWLMLAVAAIYTPIFYRFIAQIGSDFGTHNRAILQMIETRDLMLPHFLYHIVAGVFWVLLSPLLGLLTPNRISQVNAASLLTEVLLYEFIALVIYFELWSAARQRAATGDVEPVVWRPAVVATLSLLLAGPLLLLWPIDRSKYFGYIATNALHNPTLPALKPFALLLFACVALAFVERAKAPVGTSASNDENPVGSETAKRSDWPLWLAAAVLTWLSALAKPSFIICLLPAVMVYAAYRIICRRQVDWVLVSLGVVLPTLLMLAWQFWFTYQTKGTPAAEGTDGGGVIFAPFAALGARSTRLLPKFIFSIAFPMAVYLLYFARARTDVRLNLAWLIFGFGAFFSYFMAETGRVRHGNFIWSGQIALFVLFVQSMIFLARETAIFEKAASLRSFFASDRRLIWCLAIYGAHFISGVYSYIYLLRVPTGTSNPYD